MRRRFGRPVEVGAAALAIVLAGGLIGQTEAAGLPAAADGTGRPSVSQCGATEVGCGRIRGHIPAASDSAGMDTIGGPPGVGAPLAPLVSDLGAASRAAAGSLNRGLFLLRVSHDPSLH